MPSEPITPEATEQLLNDAFWAIHRGSYAENSLVGLLAEHVRFYREEAARLKAEVSALEDAVKMLAHANGAAQDKLRALGL